MKKYQYFTVTKLLLHIYLPNWEPLLRIKESIGNNGKKNDKKKSLGLEK